MADLSQTARNPSRDFMRAAPRNGTFGIFSDLTAASYNPQSNQQGVSTFFNAPKLIKPLTLGSTSRGMTDGSLSARDNFGGGGYEPFNQNPDFDTPEKRAAYYAENPTMGAITRAGQTALGFLPGGIGALMALQNRIDPGLQQEARAETYGTVIDIGDPIGSSDIQGTPLGDLAPGSNYNAPGDDSMDFGSEAQGGLIGNQDFGGGFDYGGSYDSFSSDVGTNEGSGTGYGGDGIGFAQGGLVDRVGGFNPPGPDDGVGYLQLGEYVIRKSAVDKYGQGLLDMINEGKIPTSAIPASIPVLAKTWDAVSAQKAKMLEDIGVDPKTIWQQTGTWKGPDGKWRQEVMR